MKASSCLLLCLVLAVPCLGAQKADARPDAAMDAALREAVGEFSTFTVRNSDTLQRIAGESFGDSKAWPFVWYFNRERIPDPDRVAKGTVLKVPVPRSGLDARAMAELFDTVYRFAYRSYRADKKRSDGQRRWVLLQARDAGVDVLGLSWNAELVPHDRAWLALRTGRAEGSTDTLGSLISVIEQNDATGAEAAVLRLGAARDQDELIRALEAQAAVETAPPSVHFALALLYGRKGLHAKEYAALVKAEKAAREQPGLQFNLALVHGRKQLLENRADADSILTGSLDLQSDPPGARVRVDGVARGTTPLVLEGVKPGLRKVEFSLLGTEPRTLGAEVSVGGRVALKPALSRSGLVFADDFEGWTDTEKAPAWKFNRREGMAYEVRSGAGVEGSRGLVLTDGNNGDRAHVYRDLPEGLQRGLVKVMVWLPSGTGAGGGAGTPAAADFAEVQLKGRVLGDLADISVMRKEGGGYRAMYLGESPDGQMDWRLAADHLKADTWIELGLLFDNMRREVEIRVDGVSCGIHPYRESGTVERLELNGGGWQNSSPMAVRFDEVVIRDAELAFDDTILVGGGTFAPGAKPAAGPDTRPRVTLAPWRMGRAQVSRDRVARLANWALDNGLAVMRGTRLYAVENQKTHLFDFSQEYRFGDLVDGRIRSGSDEPMGHGSWYLACAVANWESLRRGLVPAYDLAAWTLDEGATGYRLPTEAQWEFAARNGGREVRWPWGDQVPGKGSPALANVHDETMQQKGWTKAKLYFAGYDDGYAGTNPANAFPPNELGFRDLYGNLWELTRVEGGQGLRFVHRGAGYDVPHDPTSLPDLYTRQEAEAYTFAGFRLVRPETAEPAVADLPIMDTYPSDWEPWLKAPDKTLVHGLSFFGRQLWWNFYEQKTINRVDGTGKVLTSFRHEGAKLTGLTNDGKKLWVTSEDNRFYSIDAQGRKGQSVALPGPDSTALWWHQGSLWNTGFMGAVHQVAMDGRVIRTLKTPGPNNEGLVVGRERIFVSDWDKGVIHVLDWEGRLVSTIPLPMKKSNALAWDGTWLYVSGSDDSRMYRLRLRGRASPWGTTGFARGAGVNQVLDGGFGAPEAARGRQDMMVVNHSGTNSFAVVPTGGRSDGPAWRALVRTPGSVAWEPHFKLHGLGADEGKTYTWSVWARASEPAIITMQMRFLNEEVFFGSEERFVLGPEWKEYFFTRKASRSTQGDLMVMTWFKDAGVEYYFDDARFFEGEWVPADRAAGGASPGQAGGPGGGEVPDWRFM